MSDRLADAEERSRTRAGQGETHDNRRLHVVVPVLAVVVMLLPVEALSAECVTPALGKLDATRRKASERGKGRRVGR